MKCSDCRYWVPVPWFEDESDCRYWVPVPWFENEVEGHCKRYPPRVLESNPETGERQALPVTQADDFCGEFAVK